ncbi:type IV pilin N-terminal domain-containing protein [Salinigranum marinum]|uniref:type IV pilin N-terminal domain-containing protein n=1 Tax=Salinigranum marinum TaxID=1515595 RepID=UPI002989F73A|nr:type IV pilin N-terminal domain-containing protein [Salinigranum marinum]
MNFKQLLTEDRAVSPVIGVILMVAITVILAAVIGTFVLGLGDQVSESAPQAQFTFNLDSSTDQLTITHDGGDAISSDNINITGGGNDVRWDNSQGITTAYDVSAGNSTVLNDGTVAGGGTEDAVTAGETIRIVWSSPNSDKTATVGQFEA